MCESAPLSIPSPQPAHPARPAVLCCPNSIDITNMTENAKNVQFHTGCADVRYHIRHLFCLSVRFACLLSLVYQRVIACVCFCACVYRWTWSLKAKFTSVFPSLDPSLMVRQRMHIESFPSCINKAYLSHYRTYNACPPLYESFEAFVGVGVCFVMTLKGGMCKVWWLAFFRNLMTSALTACVPQICTWPFNQKMYAIYADLLEVASLK